MGFAPSEFPIWATWFLFHVLTLMVCCMNLFVKASAPGAAADVDVAVAVDGHLHRLNSVCSALVASHALVLHSPALLALTLIACY